MHIHYTTDSNKRLLSDCVVVPIYMFGSDVCVLQILKEILEPEIVEGVMRFVADMGYYKKLHKLSYSFLD